MDTTFDYFVAQFALLDVRVLAVRKIYLTKYILMVLNDGQKILNFRTEKKTEDLRKVYGNIKNVYPNFPISQDHTDNLYRILVFAKEELSQNRKIVLEYLYAFFFKAKSHNVLTKEFDKEQQKLMLTMSTPAREITKVPSESTLSSSVVPTPSSQLPRKTSESDASPAAIPTLKVQNPDSQGSRRSFDFKSSKPPVDPLSKLFAKLFVLKDQSHWCNFQRMVLHERHLSTLELPRFLQQIFEVQFRLGRHATWKNCFLKFEDAAFFLYEEKRNYLINRDSFIVLCVLVKIDEVCITGKDQLFTEIRLIDNSNYMSFDFLIKSDTVEIFSLLMVWQILKRDSTMIDLKRLPEPVNVLGNALIHIEAREQKNDPNDSNITLTSTFLKIPIKSMSSPKLLILPIMNVFDVFVFTTSKQEVILEVLSLFNLEYGQKREFIRLENHILSATRIFDYFYAYLYPPLENYHETRFLAGTLKKSMKELSISSFRLKRFFAYRDFLVTAWVEFSVFKYPAFTTFVLIFSMIFTYLFGFGIYLSFLILLFFVYFNPHVNPSIDRFLNEHVFNPKYINKHYIPRKIETERIKRKAFHLDLANVNKKTNTNMSFKEKIQGAWDFSSKVPSQIHMLIDFFEKAKNIFLWRDYRKTQLFIFMFLVLTLVLVFVGKELTFILICLFRLVYDRNYYRRVRLWNEKVLNFLIDYFIQKEYPYYEGSIQDFFLINAADEQFKFLFSRKFSEFVLKQLDVKTEENFWRDKFSVAAIMQQLHFSSSRILLNFYEEKRKPNLRFLSYYFWFSTPSDFYYHNLENKEFFVSTD